MNAGVVRGARRRLIFLRDWLPFRGVRDRKHCAVQSTPTLRMLNDSATHRMTLSNGSIDSGEHVDHVFLTRLLNNHRLEENTWPLKNKAIQPRLIDSASREESHRLMQKNQGISRTRLQQPRSVTKAGRIFESAFCDGFRRDGVASPLVHRSIWRPLITFLSLQCGRRTEPARGASPVVLGEGLAAPETCVGAARLER